MAGCVWQIIHHDSSNKSQMMSYRQIIFWKVRWVINKVSFLLYRWDYISLKYIMYPFIKWVSNTITNLRNVLIMVRKKSSCIWFMSSIGKKMQHYLNFYNLNVTLFDYILKWTLMYWCMLKRKKNTNYKLTLMMQN